MNPKRISIVRAIIVGLTLIVSTNISLSAIAATGEQKTTEYN
jgi:hypothetical protein